MWPHVSIFVAAGLAGYGFRKEDGAVIAGIFEASMFFRYRLPEVFAGYERAKTRYPVEYTTSCSPQAWAAGAPMLGIRTLLGLEPKGETLTSAAAAVLPPWMGTLTVENIPGRGGKANIVAKGDEKTMLSVKQIYDQILTARSDLGTEELAA